MIKTSIPSYFAHRRSRLFEGFSKQKVDGAAVVLFSNQELTRNHDVHFLFRQDSSFYYLTGLDEPGSVCVLLSKEASSLSAAKNHETILFVAPKDEEKELWEGERYGVEGAMRVFGADRSYPLAELGQRLPELLSTANRLFYRLNRPHSEHEDRLMIEALEKCKKAQGRSGKALMTVEDPQIVIGEMRLFKAPEEIELMRRASKISAAAHNSLLREVKPGMNESQVEALIDFHFRKDGCERNAYPSIVAGGKNAACLHYRRNNEILRDGDILLVDAGGECDYYAADITRTIPVGAKFSGDQTKAYDLVLKTHKMAIEMVKPGVSMVQIHRAVSESLAEGCLQLGLFNGLQSSPADVVASGAIKRYYPHQTSHWLGMDVHDAGLYQLNGEPRLLEPGMVLTIEPGFYVQANNEQVAPGFRNIGIRIEDDILVVAGGYENFTLDAIKERAQIESERAKALK